MFFQWVVQNPDEAKEVLSRWKNIEFGCGI